MSSRSVRAPVAVALEQAAGGGLDGRSSIRHGQRVKNDAWAAFTGIRDDCRRAFADILATYLGGDRRERVIGAVAGALHVLVALPYSGGVADEVRRGLPAAHRANRSEGHPCGCRKYKRCVIDEIGPRELLMAIGRDGSMFDDLYPEDIAET